MNLKLTFYHLNQLVHTYIIQSFRLNIIKIWELFENISKLSSLKNHIKESNNLVAGSEAPSLFLHLQV